MSDNTVFRGVRMALAALLAGAVLFGCAPVTGEAPGVSGGTAPTPTGPPPQSVCGFSLSDLAGWRGYLDLARVDPTASAKFVSYVRTGNALFASWGGMDAAQVSEILAGTPTDAPGVIRQQLVVLGLNVASGRLNRGSLVSTTSGAVTVGELISGLEQALADGDPATGLIAASQALLAGAPLEQVCARVVTVANNDTIIERWWTPAGASQRTVAQLSQVPGEPLAVTALHHSPDFRYAIVQTHGHDAGGPLLLLDLASGEMSNLNQRAGLTVSASGGPSPLDDQELWQVIGWHPDGRHLMVTAEGQDAVLWVDVVAGTYERIALPDGGGTVSSDRGITLRPDGAAFAYVDGEGTGLWLYDMGSGQTTRLLGPRASGAYLEYPTYSPDGSTIALLVQSGEPMGSQYALEALDPATGALTLIAQGDLGLAAPLWSEDGQWLAYSRGSGNAVDSRAAPDALERFSFVWAVNVTTQDTRLVATSGANVCQEAWGVSSSSLAYAVGGGLTTTPAEDTTRSWQGAGGLSSIAVSGSAFFLP
jgi:hypothetical protein